MLTFTKPNVLPGWGSEKAFNKDLKVSKFVPSLSAEFQNAAIKLTFCVLVAIRPILQKKLKKGENAHVEFSLALLTQARHH